MNIYRHELKTYRLNTIIWISALCSMMFLVMLFYPTIKSDIDGFVKLLDNYPPAMKAAMGFVVDDFGTPLGFYCFGFTYIVLLGAIQAMNLGIGIVSKEERERTADFLMTKPVSRIKIITIKLMTVITILLITNAIYLAISVAVVSGVSKDSIDINKLIMINLSLLFSQVIFFVIGLVISIIAKKIKAVLPISLGLVFMFYAISAFGISSERDILRFITPFQYFKTSYIMAEGRIDLKFASAGIIVAFVGVLVSYYIYNRKSIPAV